MDREKSVLIGLMVSGVELTGAAAEEPDVRLQVSLRLKAARYLAGGLRKTKAGMEASALTVEELAAHPVIRANGIKKNRLDAYEQMRTDPRPMELRVIAEALKVAPSFLLEPLSAPSPRPAIEETLKTLEDTLTVLRDELPRLGRDIGKRDLELRAAKGRRDSSRQAVG